MSRLQKFYYDKLNDVIYYSFAENGSYIKSVYDEDNCICFFDVYYVPEQGGEPILDSHCNTLPEAMGQLEMASM